MNRSDATLRGELARRRLLAVSAVLALAGAAAAAPLRERTGLGARASSAERSRRGGLVSLRAGDAGAVSERAVTLELGSAEPELVDALMSCKREPLPERCDETTFQNELSPRSVDVPAFWISRTEVTVGEYRRCALRGRCPSVDLAGGGARFARADYPMTLVTFEEARDYCAAASGRLPSEAEFERAARGPARR